jgi:hypothetical protein
VTSVELAPRTGLIGRPRTNGLDLPPDLTFDEWAGAVDHADMIVESSPWWLVSLMAYGEAHFGERSSQVFPTREDDPQGIKQSRLKQAAWMASVYPTESTRVTGLSYTHHRVAADLEPETRARVLQDAAAGGWSTRELISVVKTEQEKARAIPAASESVCAADTEPPAWVPKTEDLTEEAAARMRFELAMRGARDAASFGEGWCAALAWLEALDCFKRD